MATCCSARNFALGIVLGFMGGLALVSLLKRKRKTLDIEKEFSMSKEEMQLIIDEFIKELNEGLQKDGQLLPMLVSHVSKMPKGMEHGRFVALDLGGTNFRISLIELGLGGKKGKKKLIKTVKQEKYHIPQHLKEGKGQDLFAFVAEMVQKFLGSERNLKMGFTFSFPVEQLSINKGKILGWSKDFACNDVLQMDPVALLQQELIKKGVDVKVSALVNDTVGTLACGRFKDQDTMIGVILGTGSNAAYVEKCENISKFQCDSEEMIINIEWGAFSKYLPITKYDKLVDAGSKNVGKQTFEKLISGYYLGEIARLALCDMIKNGDLFESDASEKFSKPHLFDASLMSAVEADLSIKMEETERLFREKYHISTTEADRIKVKKIFSCISLRSARLAALGVISIIKKIGMVGKKCIVAIDGSLFELYVYYKERMVETFIEVLGDDSAQQIELTFVKDASSAGSAVIAALFE